MKRIALALSAALAVSVAAYAAQAKPASLVGKKIPSFKIMDLSGKAHTEKSLKGKVVVLDFWASWCGPCKAASPTMQALHEKYGKQGLVVIGANTSDPKAYAAKYAKDHKYSYTFAIGAEPLKKKLVGENAIPLFVFVDRTGTVRTVKTGFKASESPAEFEAVVKKLVAQK